eukprot:5437507-Karenia_brevis.AAC.1
MIDMIDIAERMLKSRKARAKPQSLVAAQAEREQQLPQEALALPTGKPLSLFEPSALPAACMELVCGDFVP